MSNNSYHDIYVSYVDREGHHLKFRLFDAPCNYRITCTRAGGWELWHHTLGKEPKLLAGEYNEIQLTVSLTDGTYLCNPPPNIKENSKEEESTIRNRHLLFTEVFGMVKSGFLEYVEKHNTILSHLVIGTHIIEDVCANIALALLTNKLYIDENKHVNVPGSQMMGDEQHIIGELVYDHYGMQGPPKLVVRWNTAIKAGMKLYGDSAVKRIAELEAENIELRKDAERYRWLINERLEHSSDDTIYLCCQGVCLPAEDTKGCIDATIDATMNERAINY
jgi:hypothetical protein